MSNKSLTRHLYRAIILLPFLAYGEWQIDSVKSFGNPSSSEAQISSSVIAANDGFLYGTAQTGGIADRGVVFRMNRFGSNYSVLHAFQTGEADGKAPVSSMLQASDAKLYGTTSL